MKYLFKILMILYIITTLVLTFLMLKYNDEGYIMYDNYSYIINNGLNDYGEKSLIKFNKQVNYSTITNQEIYYLDKDNKIIKGIVTEITKENDKNIVEINRELYQEDRILGNKIVKEYNLLGRIITMLYNKYIYSIIFVLPIFVYFCYSLYKLIKYLITIKK